jgi:hypothetical protein
MATKALVPAALRIIEPADAFNLIANVKPLSPTYNRKEAERNLRRHKEKPANFHLRVFSLLVDQESDACPQRPESLVINTLAAPGIHILYAANFDTGRILAFPRSEDKTVGLPKPIADFYVDLSNVKGADVLPRVEETLKILL